jgi:hypothetical protein
MPGNTVRPMSAVRAARDAAASFARAQATQHPDHGFPAENPKNAGTERWPVQPVTVRITRGRADGPGGLSAR